MDDDEEVAEIELDVLEVLDVIEVEIVEAAVLMQEQPLETLEGIPEQAVVAQGGSVTWAVAVVYIKQKDSAEEAIIARYWSSETLTPSTD
jgi:hypothetical protein